MLNLLFIAVVWAVRGGATVLGGFTSYISPSSVILSLIFRKTKNDSVGRELDVQIVDRYAGTDEKKVLSRAWVSNYLNIVLTPKWKQFQFIIL